MAAEEEHYRVMKEKEGLKASLGDGEAREMVKAGVPADYIYYTLSFDRELSVLIEAGEELELKGSEELTEILVEMARYLKEKDEKNSFLTNTIASEPISSEEAEKRINFIMERFNKGEYDESEIFERASHLRLAEKPEEGLKDIGLELVDKYLELGIPAPVLALGIVGALGRVFKSNIKESIRVEI